MSQAVNQPTDHDSGALVTDRREFIAAGGALALSLKYALPAAAQDAPADAYGRWEDVMREKWTWDRVVHGSRGINCTGHCAFNIYVKNGIVWREEQQGEYGRSGDDDTPDYGPRGCQKGLRQAKYMYGKQRVLYPMKRAGKRGEGKWERVSWDQALSEIADRFIDTAAEHGPDSISFAMGTQMILKRASLTALFRFANITGVVVPETFAGVGDLPVGAHMTLGYELPGDNMAAVYKSRTCLVWVCNPAATRIPDAHFFWEARYNGTEVVTISPEFSATAIHSSKWVNPKPGTDTALALGMVHTMLADREHIDWAYVKEQTDLPMLVRLDNQKFLRGTDLAKDGNPLEFHFWDQAAGKAVRAPATGYDYANVPPGAPKPSEEKLLLDGIDPALEGEWEIEAVDGPVRVTTVFELVKKMVQDYTPEKVQETTGVHPDVTRDIARRFASAPPAMIYSGYRSCKWLHGDKLQRAWLLMLALTGNTGRDGGGLQTTQLSKADGIFKFVFNGIGPRMRIAAISLWDYAHADHKELNEAIYGNELAEHFDSHIQQAYDKGWAPDYSKIPWKMGIFAGHNPANWRATGKGFRQNAFEQLETVVTMTPDMSVTAMYSDYVLPVAQHYERDDITMEGRTPYVQVLTAAVPPVGESKDDFVIMAEFAKKISEKATARGMAPLEDSMFGNPVPRDFSKTYELFTSFVDQDGQVAKIDSSRKLAEFLLNNSFGIPKTSFDEIAEKGFIRVDDADGTQFGKNSPYSYYVLARTRDKEPYDTLTARQQFYFDHDWFLAEGEQLPVHVDPLAIKGYPLRLTMGHARHGIHSMWRDDPLLVSLQRGEPDVFLSVEDSKARGVADGDLVKVFNNYGSFIAQAHVSAGMQPGQLFMYHGWDPMMFRGRENFSSVITTGGLIKPTSMVGEYGHLGYRTPNYVPNQTFHDCTCEFEKYTEAA